MAKLVETSFFDSVRTPVYFYDMTLLRETADRLREASERYGINIHYAVKANSEDPVLAVMKDSGFGADCVSGGEVSKALHAGFAPGKIFFAGVGKTDEEMELALEAGIACFNVESVEELEVLSELAASSGRIAPVALRVNPNVDAHTLKGITTGLEENKFGIADCRLQDAISLLKRSRFLSFRGLHFHVGSQILDIESVYPEFCAKVSETVKRFEDMGLHVSSIDLGGGLGVDYEHPDAHPIPDFDGWMKVIDRCLDCRQGRSIHLEPGRSLVAQCGSLVSRVVFVKKSGNRDFLILDAGFNNLLRPVLYGAYHSIENLSASQAGQERPECVYDVVGPICESTDIFAADRRMPMSRRGDIVAIRSAGAYGAVMASDYNMHGIAKAVFYEKK